jgi:rRNA maturation endonuclease Nob1
MSPPTVLIRLRCLECRHLIEVGQIHEVRGCPKCGGPVEVQSAVRLGDVGPRNV